MSNLFSSVQLAFYRRFYDEDAQGLTEYALIIVLIAIVDVVSLGFLSKGSQDRADFSGNEPLVVGYDSTGQHRRRTPSDRAQRKKRSWIKRG